MFKMKRAQPEEPRQDAPADIHGSKPDDTGLPVQAKPAGPAAGRAAEGLKSKVPPALITKRRQTAPPDGATIRQQFETVRRYAAEPRFGIGPEPGHSAAEEPSKLVIGREISFKGQIGDCKTLVVEGKVSANAKCTSLHVLESGVYDGEIEVETAEISGRVEGRIRIRRRLTIHAAGRVSGDVVYGELEITAGGRLLGDIRHEPIAEPAAETKPETTSKPAPSPRPTVDKAPEAAPSGLPDPSNVGPQARQSASAGGETSSPRDGAGEASTGAPDQAPKPIAVGAAGTRP